MEKPYLRPMKTLTCLAGSLFLAVGLLAASAEDKTNATPSAVGIYDSRAVAYAYFTSAPQQKNLQERMTAAKAAQQAGDDAKLMEYQTSLRGLQDQLHREVFSTAPATEAMAALKDRVPEIQKQAGVIAILSKWDATALAKYKDAAQIDVTDQLVHEFIQPNEKQSKTISGIVKSEPLSLEKCEELIRAGKI
jgi:Met-zincin